MKFLHILVVIVFLTAAIVLRAQPNQAYSHGDPTPEEQLMLEMINRARANPAEEGARLMDTEDSEVQSAYSYFKINKVATKAAFNAYPQRPPLVFHPMLLDASRGHSRDMDANNFQGHTSSNGKSLSTRYADVGYASQGMFGENVAAYSESVWYGHCGLNVDWGEENQQVLGHRSNIMNFNSSVFTEIGIGIVINNRGLSQNWVGPLVITQNFGIRAVRYITGVVYVDKNNNGFYDIGEGLPGVKVMPSRGTYFATTSSSGGYAIPFTGPGSVTLTASEGGLSESITRTANFDGSNLKVDLIPASQAPGAVTLSKPANNATGVVTTITLEWAKATLADSYEWVVSSSNTFSTATIVASGNGTALTASATVPQCNTRYFWRVRAVNDVGAGQWSATFSFTTGGKIPTGVTTIGPKGDVRVEYNAAVTFRWNSVADASGYQMRIKQAQSPFGTIFEENSISGVTLDVASTVLANSSSFTWEVRAVNGCGNGGWSTPATIAVTITDVDEIAGTNGWQVSAKPFPVTDEASVSVQAPITGHVSYQVMSLAGSQVSAGGLNVEAGLNRIPVQIPSVPGAYVLLIDHNGLVVARFVMVVQ